MFLVLGAWVGMIERCYDNKYHIKKPTYKGCTVCDEWLNFQNFAKWYTEHEYYGISGYQLDKDILITGNKKYSPETCELVPSQINSLLLDSKKSRGDYPIGVTLYRGRYKSTISIDGKRVHLGLYDTIKEASDVYHKSKMYNIKRVSLLYKDKIPKRIFYKLIEMTI